MVQLIRPPLQTVSSLRKYCTAEDEFPGLVIVVNKVYLLWPHIGQFPDRIYQLAYLAAK